MDKSGIERSLCGRGGIEKRRKDRTRGRRVRNIREAEDTSER